VQQHTLKRSEIVGIVLIGLAVITLLIRNSQLSAAGASCSSSLDLDRAGLDPTHRLDLRAAVGRDLAREGQIAQGNLARQPGGRP